MPVAMTLTNRRGRARTSGVLVHPTSLPGPYGSGDLGKSAREFVDAMHEARQGVWQMLPVGPPGFGDSPYAAHSSFAGSPMLIDLDALDVPVDRDGAAKLSVAEVDFASTRAFRERHLRSGFARFSEHASPDARRTFERFSESEAAWLEDWALYAALKHAHQGTAWTSWEAALRDRDAAALEHARRVHESDLTYAKWVQYEFHKQWQSLRAYAHERGIRLIGDLPIFVAHDSADVWAARTLFDLDDHGLPRTVTGVPPDYFSATGQRWGNPPYLWPRHRKTDYAYWILRVKKATERFDWIRLDHFIGFVRAWCIPAEDATAERGRFVRGPGDGLFQSLEDSLGDLPFFAEDLGVVTPAVERLRRGWGFPGMRILQFAFGADPAAHTFLPHAFSRNTVVYTGTHDNDTTVGWYEDDGAVGTRSPDEIASERARLRAYVARETGAFEPAWELVRLAFSSVANTAIVPIQDLLSLGSSSRTNTPGVASGNWRFRVERGAISKDLLARLRAVSETYGRMPSEASSKPETKRGLPT